MYINLKKSTSMIILASIVATANISMFAGYAAGPSGDLKTELGESNLAIGCSKSHYVKFCNELTYEKNDDLVEAICVLKSVLDIEKNKSECLDNHFTNLEQVFNSEVKENIIRMKESLEISYRNLVKSKIKFKNYKIQKKHREELRILSENQKSFDDNCAEFRKQLQFADDILSQLNKNFLDSSHHNNLVRKMYEKYLEMEAQYYNLNKFDRFNEYFDKHNKICKQYTLAKIGYRNFNITAEKIKIESFKKLLELLEKSEKQVNWEKQQSDIPPNLDLLDLFRELSKLENDNSEWVQILHQYISLMDKDILMDNAALLEDSKIAIKNGERDQIIEDFSEIRSKLIGKVRSQYNAEHAKSKTEIGANFSTEYDNKQFENNTSEEVKGIGKLDNSTPELRVNDAPKETVQVKIDKSSDYNKEKKLKLKKEKRKDKRIAKRGTVKVKDINYQGENSKENAGVYIKAKIVKLDKPKEVVDLRDNDCESTLSNPSEGSNDSTSSDSNSSELSSTGSEGDSKGIDDNNNLEMSDEEIRGKLSEVIKLRGPQSDNEFIKYLYDEFMKYPLSKTEN